MSTSSLVTEKFMFKNGLISSKVQNRV